MKKLSTVTLEDAIEIIKAVHSGFFETGKWKLVDMSEDVGDPCKMLSAKHKAYQFWFFDDKIDSDVVDDDSDVGFDRSVQDIFSDYSEILDARYKYYIKAHKLGYYVPELSELLNNKQLQ